MVTKVNLNQDCLRVMTERGLVYSLDQKLKARESCYRKLSNASDDVDEFLSENPDKDKVKCLLQELCKHQ